MLTTKTLAAFMQDLINEDPHVFKVLIDEYYALDQVIAPYLVKSNLTKPALFNTHINHNYPLPIVQYYYLHWHIKCKRQPDYRAAYYLSRIYLALTE